MNVKQFMLSKGINKDKMSHNDFYTKVVDELGYKDILKNIPFSLLEIKKALKEDIYLNNLPLKEWDSHTGLYYIYKKHGIDCCSLCDGVCILKQCARLAVEREHIK